MQNIKDKKIGELVTDNYKFADVFKLHGIDFCCGGGISVQEACKKQGLDYNLVVSELNKIGEPEEIENDFRHWEIDEMIDHIVKIHHSYVKTSLPLLVEYATKVASVHGEAHPEVITIKDLILDLENDLMPHLKKEEDILFPYIKIMVASQIVDETPIKAPFGSVENPISLMLTEHELAGDILKSISTLSNGYTPPTDACNTFKVLYHKLNEFEEDLHLHIHIENNILFPRALAMESGFSNDYHFIK
jgi:regulator of cell morphogenesis and NO signaling